MMNKDVVAPGLTQRRIERPGDAPRLPAEYKKGENQTNAEITKEEDQRRC